MNTETLTISTRLGRPASTTILLGWVVEILVIAFLLYLWIGPGPAIERSNATKVWHWIMLNDLAAQAITIASMILRTAIGLQATICTALAAAVFLESRVVRMPDIPLFSVLRAVNGGPWSIVEPLICTPRRLFGSIPAWLVLVLFTTAISSELTSTLLLADFRRDSLLDKSITNATAVIETHPELLLYSVNEDQARSWRSAPSTYPTFGEIAVRPSQTLPGQTDTGRSKRAFLPFDTRGRQRLGKYSGPALTYTSEVVCSRPLIRGSLYFTPDVILPQYRKPWPRIHGTVSWHRKSASIGHCQLGEEDCGFLPFDCAMPFGNGGLPSAGLTTILNNRPTTVCLLKHLGQSVGHERNFTNIFLAIDTSKNSSWTDLNIATDAAASFKNFSGNFPGHELPAPTNVEEWASYEFSPNSIYDITVCQSYTDLWLNYVEAETLVPTKEPSLSYDPTSEIWLMDDIVSMVRKTDELSNSERGVMTITNISDLTDQDLQQMFQESINFEALSSAGTALDFLAQFIHYILDVVKRDVLDFEGGQNFTVYFCSQCFLDDGEFLKPDPTYTLLFHAILERTGSFACAYQSILFWMTQALYYKALPGFDYRGNATMVYLADVNIPRAWTGFTIVIAVIVINMICVAAITFYFLSRTKYSIYGNTWHTIAQMVSPDTRNMLERATCSTDDHVKKVLRNSGSENMNAGLHKLDSGRVAVLRNNAPFRYMKVGQ